MSIRPFSRALVASLALGLAAIPGARARAASPPANLSGQPKGEIVSGIPTLSDPSQTYDLYLPSRFDPAKKAPILFLFDPRSRGRLAAELFRPAAEELGWILVSSNNTLSDGPGEPNAKAINATVPDAMRRLAADEKRMYAGGFSGGGVLAWTVGLKGKYLAGVISVGGRPAPEHAALAPNFPLFAAAGLADFNYQPTRELDAIATKAGVPHRLEFFPGPHAWCPPEVARHALVWLETLAMRSGLAPRDATRIAAFAAEEAAGAKALEDAGDVVGAGRRWEEIAAAFAGLADDAARNAAAEAKRLAADPRTKASLKEAKAAEKYESQAFRRIGDALGEARGETIPPAARLEQVVGLDEAKKRLAEGGETGRAAERHLQAVATHFGFYFANEVMAAKDYRRAIPALETALAARPESPYVEYNLACARSRLGDLEAVVPLLEAAVAHGLAQPLQMENDADLEAARSRPDFRALVSRLRAAAPAG